MDLLRRALFSEARNAFARRRVLANRQASCCSRSYSTLSPSVSASTQVTSQSRGASPLAVIVFGVPILITAGLGTWQLQRMTAKKDLLRLKKERMEASSLSISPAMLTDADRQELEYRHVRIEGRFDHSHEMLVGPRMHGETLGYHLLTPFNCNDGSIVIVNRGWIPAALKDPKARVAFTMSGPVCVTGVVRRPGQPSRFVPPNDPVKGDWYYISPSEMGRTVGLMSDPLIVEVVGRVQDKVYPVPRDPLEVVGEYVMPYDHRNYAITWYTLCVGLIGLTYFRFKKGPVRPIRSFTPSSPKPHSQT